MFSVASDMPFGRQLQSYAQQKHHQQTQGPPNPSQHPCAINQPGTNAASNIGSAGNNGQNKEPSLMPVPSPQQIQYLNTFDGQELTIQKQPNTSLRDNEILSP